MSPLGIVRRSGKNLIRPSSRAHLSLKPGLDGGHSFARKVEGFIFTDTASSTDVAAISIEIGGGK